MHKVVLGTVQFGLDYGISNFNGKPSQNEAFKILDKACELGIDRLDTADAYGNSIDVIGEYHLNHKKFDILNKFSYKDCDHDIIKRTEASLKKLNINFFNVYSYHSFEDFINHKEIKAKLDLLKANGYTEKIGISIYTNDQFKLAIESEIIDVIQIPFSIIDNHKSKGKLIEKAKECGKEVHARSVFLQGLILMDSTRIPSKLKPLIRYIDQLRKFCLNEDLSMEELALTYVMQYPGIDGVLIGVENSSQLEKNLKSVKSAYYNKIVDYLESFDIIEKNLLNPQNWK